MSEAAQQALSVWIPAPIMVGALLGAIGMIATMAVMLLNRGFVSVAAFSRSSGATHKKINKLSERVAILEDRAGVLRPREMQDSDE